MRNILLKRNELKDKLTDIKHMRFEPNIKDSQIEKITKTQNDIYNKWKFYDKFIKTREKEKSK